MKTWFNQHCWDSRMLWVTAKLSVPRDLSPVLRQWTYRPSSTISHLSSSSLPDALLPSLKISLHLWMSFKWMSFKLCQDSTNLVWHPSATSQTSLHLRAEKFPLLSFRPESVIWASFLTATQDHGSYYCQSHPFLSHQTPPFWTLLFKPIILSALLLTTVVYCDLYLDFHE